MIYSEVATSFGMINHVTTSFCIDLLNLAQVLTSFGIIYKIPTFFGIIY